MNFKNSLLTLMLLISASCVSSQAQEKTDTTKRVVFFSSTPKSKAASSSEDNIIKIAPLGILSGRIPVLYERKLTDFLSIQASIGLTSRNYIRINTEGTELSDMKTTYSPLPTGTGDNAESLYSYDNRASKIGFMFGLQPRIYFQSDGLEGSFIGVSFDYLKYNYQIPSMTKNGSEYSHSGSMVKEFETYNELMVNYGFQKIYDNLTLEYGAAIGIRNLKGEKYVAAEVNSQLVDGLAKYSKSGINFNVFFRVGYHF